MPRMSRTFLAFCCGVVLLTALAFRNADRLGTSLGASNVELPIISAFALSNAHAQLISRLRNNPRESGQPINEGIVSKYQLFADVLHGLPLPEAGQQADRESFENHVRAFNGFAGYLEESSKGGTGFDPEEALARAEALGGSVSELSYALERAHISNYRKVAAHLERHSQEIWMLAIFFALIAGALIYSLGRRNYRLRRQTEALLLSERRLREMSYFRQQFLANMSHEFRTPLNAIQGFSQAILYYREEIPRDRMIAYVELVEKSSRDLAALTENVLDLSKIDNGKFDLVARDVDLTQLVSDALAQQRILADQRKIRLRHFLAEHWIIRCDANSIKRCLVNLLTNALKFSNEGSDVDLFVYRRDTNQLVIEVRDRGCGIPEHELENVWTAYTRSSLTRNTDCEGAGLGMAIVKSLVDAHNGIVELESKEGEGTTARICLPATVIVSSTRSPVRDLRASQSALQEVG